MAQLDKHTQKALLAKAAQCRKFGSVSHMQSLLEKINKKLERHQFNKQMQKNGMSVLDTPFMDKLKSEFLTHEHDSLQRIVFEGSNGTYSCTMSDGTHQTKGNIEYKFEDLSERISEGQICWHMISRLHFVKFDNKWEVYGGQFTEKYLYSLKRNELLEILRLSSQIALEIMLRQQELQRQALAD